MSFDWNDFTYKAVHGARDANLAFAREVEGAIEARMKGNMPRSKAAYKAELASIQFNVLGAGDTQYLAMHDAARSAVLGALHTVPLWELLKLRMQRQWALFFVRLRLKA